jgi:hypothetical protein
VEASEVGRALAVEVGRYAYLGGADPEEIKRAVWRNLLSREE